MIGPSQSSVLKQLDALKQNDQLRHLPNIHHRKQWVNLDGRALLNISSNDYLGLSSDIYLQSSFITHLQGLPKDQRPKMGSTSSRLLTGNNTELNLLEEDLLQWYTQALSKISEDNKALGGKTHNLNQQSESQRSVLVMNSGYHANIGILPALAKLTLNTIILTDSLVHASIIDGVRLISSKNREYCTYQRYRHNDIGHLTSIIEDLDESIERIIIVTESIFSMDGDRADLKALVNLKKDDSRVELYVDEAHAVGVLGKNGLGLAEETQTLADIDYLIGTFGKAFASMGAYIFCNEPIKQWLINQMRSFIFSTALPPITHSWTRFVLQKMPSFNHLRLHLASMSLEVKQAIENQTQIEYSSPIIPYILGDNASTISKALQFQDAGFYALPIRPPTVPVNTSRIRLVLNSKLTYDDCSRLIKLL